MKAIFVAVVLFVATTANPIPEWNVPSDGQLSKIVDDCLTLNAHLPQGQYRKCTVKCAYEKIGIFDEASGFNVERLIKAEMQKFEFSESAARALAEKCAVEKKASETNCEWAARGHECLRIHESKLMST